MIWKSSSRVPSGTLQGLLLRCFQFEIFISAESLLSWNCDQHRIILGFEIVISTDLFLSLRFWSTQNYFQFEIVISGELSASYCNYSTTQFPYLFWWNIFETGPYPYHHHSNHSSASWTCRLAWGPSWATWWWLITPEQIHRSLSPRFHPGFINFPQKDAGHEIDCCLFHLLMTNTLPLICW